MNKIKRLLVISLAHCLLLMSSTTAFAQTAERLVNVGSVSVLMKCSYDGGKVFANYSASDYVDTYMRVTSKFVASSGASDAVLERYFDQMTYGAVDVTYPNTVIRISSGYKFYSNDGNTWTGTIDAG